jgi:hypothetical protein
LAATRSPRPVPGTPRATQAAPAPTSRSAGAATAAAASAEPRLPSM